MGGAFGLMGVADFANCKNLNCKSLLPAKNYRLYCLYLHVLCALNNDKVHSLVNGLDYGIKETKYKLIIIIFMKALHSLVDYDDDSDEEVTPNDTLDDYSYQPNSPKRQKLENS